MNTALEFIMIHGSRLRFAALFALLFVFGACDDAVTPPELSSISATAAASSDLTTLVAALTEADLVDALDADGSFTVFAPRNAAFEALGSDVVAGLLADGNEALLSRVLTLHVVSGTVAFSSDLSDGQTVTTLEGSDLTIGVSGGGVTVNGANVITADIETTNGVVHIIDEVLVPAETDVYETAALTAGTSTLASAVLAAGLDDDLAGTGPFTVFAPTDAAFEALGSATVGNLLDPANTSILEDLLSYHVIAGAKVMAADLTDGAMVGTFEGGDVTIDLSDPTMPMVNGVLISTTDIEVENGVIHLIDAVLTESLDIVERATVTDGTGTLATAVAEATANGSLDVAGVLQSTGPYTVFAPVDAAFEALGTDRLNVLLDSANADVLDKLLTYHAISGDYRAADLSDGATLTTLAGADVTFDLSDPTMPMINGAAIIATDIVTENGVIHLIDGVLTESLDLIDVATVEGFPTLVSLVEQQGLTTTLRSDNGGAGWTVFAPTEAAFGALASVPTGQALTDILTYHVLDAEVGSSALSDGLVVNNTVNGASFTVNIAGSAVTITDQAGNTVNVTLTDVPAFNGVIHVIDGVIIPTP